MSETVDPQHESTMQRGDRMRRRVLGDAHVDRSRSNATDFSRPLQELVTEYCWGAVWTRTELPPRDRSLINLAMIATLGKQHELSLHVRGAVRNGLTVEEIREVLLQTAIYAGVPAALEATRTADETLKAMDAESADA